MLWNPAFYGPVFSATMSLARFRVLAAHIRFDDDGTRRGQHGRWQNDKFAAMRYPAQYGIFLCTQLSTQMDCLIIAKGTFSL
jgi:hypothetical protein